MKSDIPQIKYSSTYILNNKTTITVPGDERKLKDMNLNEDRKDIHEFLFKVTFLFTQPNSKGNTFYAIREDFRGKKQTILQFKGHSLCV